MKKLYVLLAAMLLVLQCHPSQAEDTVLTTIEEAVRQYKAGDYAEAASNLDYASQLIRQQKSEKLQQLLPEAPPGWQAKEATAQSIGSAILGGGITVSREYSKGGSSLSLEIVSDSPVLQSVLMVINNPMFAGAGGGKLETLKGQRSIVKYDSNKQEGEVYIVVGGRFMVTVKGSQVERAELIRLAEAVDYEQLADH
ncbi:hypothetical protein [Desulfogranum mediterraneum]|uniref:hypothetical protein n=1 Tax=Desulfogranum mediterraneum TaxID=160661 RepID=UPI00068804E4|nr:hypothetical protein [Desulfogranum mediterraneum]